MASVLPPTEIHKLKIKSNRAGSRMARGSSKFRAIGHFRIRFSAHSEPVLIWFSAAIFHRIFLAEAPVGIQDGDFSFGEA
jgi:hypothetical protein